MFSQVNIEGSIKASMLLMRQFAKACDDVKPVLTWEGAHSSTLCPNLMTHAGHKLPWALETGYGVGLFWLTLLREWNTEYDAVVSSELLTLPTPFHDYDGCVATGSLRSTL